MYTLTVMEILTDNPILFIALIIFALFWIIFAVYFIIKNRRITKSKENLPACKPKTSGTV
jgi:succinate-acetate transporter protein